MSIMKNLSDYFTLDTTIHPGKGVMFYTFDNAKRMEFIQDCLLPFREAYIESKKLQDIVKYMACRFKKRWKEDYQTKEK